MVEITGIYMGENLQLPSPCCCLKFISLLVLQIIMSYNVALRSAVLHCLVNVGILIWSISDTVYIYI